MPIDRRGSPDNSGRVTGLLTIEGDVDEARKQLCELLGAGDCASRIQLKPQSSAVVVDFTGIDLNTNEGARLLGQLVHSEYAYNLTIGSQYRTAAGLKSLGRMQSSTTQIPSTHPDFALKSPQEMLSVSRFNSFSHDFQPKIVT